MLPLMSLVLYVEGRTQDVPACLTDAKRSLEGFKIDVGSLQRQICEFAFTMILQLARGLLL